MVQFARLIRQTWEISGLVVVVGYRRKYNFNLGFFGLHEMSYHMKHHIKIAVCLYFLAGKGVPEAFEKFEQEGRREVGRN